MMLIVEMGGFGMYEREDERIWCIKKYGNKKGKMGGRIYKKEN